jgi:hypothetical protein
MSGGDAALSRDSILRVDACAKQQITNTNRKNVRPIIHGGGTCIRCKHNTKTAGASVDCSVLCPRNSEPVRVKSLKLVDEPPQKTVGSNQFSCPATFDPLPT